MRLFQSLLILAVSSVFAAINVPLEVSNWADIARTGEPVTAGICLPQGAVSDLAKLRITDASGVTVPAQFRVLSKWWIEKNRDNNANPSYKWVLCDFQADAAAKNRSSRFLKDDNTAGSPATALSLAQDASKVTVITGPLKFTVSKTAFNFLDEAWIDLNGNSTFEANEQIITSSAQNGAFVIAGDWAAGECVDGTVHQSALQAPQRIIVEEEGPMKVVLRVEGRHYAASNGVTRGLYGYQVFLTAYAGKPYVDVQWAITNTYREGDKPAATGTATPYKIYAWPYKEYRVDLNLNLGASQGYTLLGVSEVSGTASSTAARVFQDSSGYTVTGAAGGVSCLGGAALYDGSKGVMAVMRDFAATNPKAFSVSAGCLGLGLSADIGRVQWVDPQGRFNSRMRLQFFSGAYAAGALTDLWKQADAPLRMLAPREWYQRCDAWYRGFGIPPSTAWDRVSPSSWTRMNKKAGQQIKRINETVYSPLNWTNFGQIQEFCGAGDHWPLTSCYFDYLNKGNPGETFGFEAAEAGTYHFNNVVPVHLSWYDDPWTQLDWFLNPEDHLAGLQQHSRPGRRYNSIVDSFPGWAEHRINVPDDGHMPNLELLEYYLLTGDQPTLDAIRSWGVAAVANILCRCYFTAYRPWNRKVVLDSVLIMPYQQRYFARPGIVAQHAYEVTGDERFLYPAKISAYSMRNYTRRNPSGYMAKVDHSYLPNSDSARLALWRVHNPTDTTYPGSLSANEFMIGIAEEMLYGYLRTTGDREIRDALIFSTKGAEWRCGLVNGVYTGWVYNNCADFLQEGRRFSECVILNGDPTRYTSSMAEGFGGLIFGYLACGRQDLWAVIEDGRPSHNPTTSFDKKVIDLWQAYYRHDSLDAAPPARVTDLSAVFEENAGVRLSWTAPGDDGTTGRATEYQIKFGPTPITDIAQRWNPVTQTGWPDLRKPWPRNNPYELETADVEAKMENYRNTVETSFWAATNIAVNPVPQAAGSPESFLVTGLKGQALHYFALVAYDELGNVSDISNVVSLTTGIENGTKDAGGLALYGACPNPFNPVTAIRFHVPADQAGKAISLRIYDMRGRLVRILADGPAKSGFQTLLWDGRNGLNRPVASGTYIYRLKTAQGTMEKRMVMVK